MRRRFALVAILALGLSGCGGGGGWAQADKDAYMKDCTSDSSILGDFGEEKAKQFCECTLDWAQKRFPDTTYEDLEKKVQGDPKIAEEAGEAFLSCATKVE